MWMTTRFDGSGGISYIIISFHLSGQNSPEKRVKNANPAVGNRVVFAGNIHSWGGKTGRVPVKAVVVGAIGHVAGLIWTKKKSFCARGSGSDE